MRSAALVMLAMIAIGLFVTACSSQPTATGTNPPPTAAPPNTAGDAGTQLQNSFDNSLPPDPTTQPQPSDNLSKDLAVQ